MKQGSKGSLGEIVHNSRHLNEPLPIDLETEIYLLSNDVKLKGS